MKLKDYLYFNRITISELARKIGVSRSYLTIVVNGRYKPSARFAKMIEEGTDGKVSYLDIIM